MQIDFIAPNWTSKWCAKGKHWVDTAIDKRKWHRKYCSDCLKKSWGDPYTPERLERRAWRGVQRLYGITQDEWMSKYIEQNGCCALCPIPLEPKPGTKVYTDHDHSTGKVRGILCPTCNNKMAGVDDTEWLARAIIYRDKFR